MPITTPLIGASLTQVWSPPQGVEPGEDGDATAPFALGTMVLAAPGMIAQFARCGADVAVDGTVAITDGVTGAGSDYTNETGQALLEGDYAFFTAPLAA